MLDSTVDFFIAMGNGRAISYRRYFGVRSNAVEPRHRHEIYLGAGGPVPARSFPQVYDFSRPEEGVVESIGRYTHTAGSFVIKARMSRNSFNVVSPFSELFSVGLEVAMQQTLFWPIVTLHASAYQIGSELVIAVGPSGSGKSTFLREHTASDPSAAIADDHVSFHVVGGKVYAFCPIWDELYGDSSTPKEIKKIRVHVLGLSPTPNREAGTLSCLLPAVLGFGLSAELTGRIMDILGMVHDSVSVNFLDGGSIASFY